MRRVNLAAIAKLSRQIADATRCPTCGKLTVVLTKAGAGDGQSSRPLAVSPATHCSCPGGPAEQRTGPTDADFMYGGLYDRSRIIDTPVAASAPLPACMVDATGHSGEERP